MSMKLNTGFITNKLRETKKFYQQVWASVSVLKMIFIY